MKAQQNFESEERKAANIARSALKASFLSQIRRTFHRRSGTMEKSTVNTRFRIGRLDRIVLKSPRYSFQSHFGSSKKGTQKASQRKGASVKSFRRRTHNKTVEVHSHSRKGGSVVAFNKNRRYNARNHIARALKQTNALEVLATSLGNNRIVLITSQIDF